MSDPSEAVAPVDAMEAELEEFLGAEDPAKKKRTVGEGQAGPSAAKKPALEVRSTPWNTISADPPCCITA